VQRQAATARRRNGTAEPGWKAPSPADRHFFAPPARDANDSRPTAAFAPDRRPTVRFAQSGRFLAHGQTVALLPLSAHTRSPFGRGAQAPKLREAPEKWRRALPAGFGQELAVAVEREGESDAGGGWVGAAGPRGCGC
jgi:hypothetical protein